MREDTKRILISIWIKAFNEGGVTLKFKEANEALRTRFQMYNVRKAAMANMSQEGTEARIACGECEISMIDELTYEVRPSTIPDAVLRMAEQAGVSIDQPQVLTKLDREAMESMERLMKRLEEEKTEGGGFDPGAAGREKANKYLGKS